MRSVSDTSGPLFDILGDLTDTDAGRPAQTWPSPQPSTPPSAAPPPPAPAAATPLPVPVAAAEQADSSNDRGPLARLRRNPAGRDRRLARVVRIPGNPGTWADRHRYQQMCDDREYEAALTADLDQLTRPVGRIGEHLVSVTPGAVWVISIRWQPTPVSFRAGVAGQELYLDGRRDRGTGAVHNAVLRSMDRVNDALARFGLDDDIDVAGALALGGSTWANTSQLDGRIVDGVLIAPPAALLWRATQPGPVIVDMAAALLERELAA